MSKTKNRVIVSEDRCKGCGLCTTVCPVGIVELDTRRINVKGFHPAGITDMDECIGCLSCAMICPDAVLKIVRETAEA